MAKAYPVIEIFGPTIQGEGALAGLPTVFVRFGGCDFRCIWCDSMYAVDPAEVRENARKLTVTEIIDEVIALTPEYTSKGGNGMWVTLSGGNPALMDFGGGMNHPDLGTNMLHARLRAAGFKVTVETQGSVWRDWLAQVGHLTVSPKPPSSGMATLANMLRTVDFIEKAELYAEEFSIKVVVFDEVDYAWAAGLLAQYPSALKFLSVGTDQDAAQDEYRLHAGVAERYRWLCEKVAADPGMRDVRVLPQLHVIAWGAKRGV